MDVSYAFLCCKKRLVGFYPYNWLMQSSLKFKQGLPVNSLLYQNFLTTSFFCIFVKTCVHFHNVAIMRMTISRLLFLKFILMFFFEFVSI